MRFIIILFLLGGCSTVEGLQTDTCDMVVRLICGVDDAKKEIE